MSAAGLEFSSFINPKLTWKTVSKGRSTLRRSRRPILKNSKMGRDQNESPKRLESQVPETGKLTGIARRFGDSMEHIPIKKRRFLFRSPSPPPQSPCDESEELEKSARVSDQPTVAVPKKSKNDSSNMETSIRVADSPDDDGKNLKATDEVCACDDDFSGIAILAACIDMLDKSSTNSVSAFEDSVTKEQIKSPKENIVDDLLPASCCVTGQIAERTKTSTASCDDRLHWDLNAPMDEWDHPLDDTVVDSTMKLETATVDCSVEKEQANVCTVNDPSLQSSISGLNTDVAFSDVNHNVCWSESAQKRDCQPGNSGHIPDEPELNRNASDINQIQLFRVKTSEKQCIEPSSCMKDEPILSGVSHAQVVDRYQIDHCLRLGSNDTEMSLSGGKSMVLVSDLQDVAVEGSASTVQVDKTEKSEMNLMLKSVSIEADFGTENTPCRVMKTSSEIVNLDEMNNELPEIPIQHYPMTSEMQDLSLSIVGASANEAPDKCFNNTSHCKVSKDPAGTSKCSEVNTDMSNPMSQPSSDACHLDAKKCETESLQSSDFDEQACNICVPNCDNIALPEKKSELDSTSCHIRDVAQYVEPYPIGRESGTTELKSAGTSFYSSNSEEVGASTSNGEKSVKYHCGMEMKNDCGRFVDLDAQIRMKIDNTSAAKGDESHVDSKELPSGDSSDHVLRLQVSHEECSQVVSTGLEGGYDSYLEDGELREHHWVDSDCKNKESEHVDYDFDNIDEKKFSNSANRPTAGDVVAVLCEKQANQLHEDLKCDDELPTVEKKFEEDHCYPHHDSFLAGDDVGKDCLKANPSTSNSTFMTQFSAMDNPEVVDMDLDDGRKSNIVSNDPKEVENDCFKDIGDVYIDGAGMKDPRGDAPFSSYRRGNHVNPRSRYSNFSHTYYRDERHIGVDESLGRGRSLRPDYGGRSGNRYWNRGQRSMVLDHSTEVGDEKFVGPSDDESLGAHQQGIFPGSRGGYSHQKRSPAGRADGYDVGPVKARDITSESGQRNNRYDRHHLTGLSRGPRDGYRGPIYETPTSNHFIKRERSFSPGVSGVDTHPPRSSRRRSRSRSKTQSPDLRPEDRMGRTRVQYQNPDNFRERRGAPFRVFDQGHRFDNNSGRMRSENCPRPGARPVRFLDGPPSGRSHGYEDDNDCKRKAYPPRSYRRSSRSKSRSCSPEFRNEGRMGRMRPTYVGPSHTRDNMPDRRSPQRMFHSGKRFDNNVASPPSRLRSGGDYMRPIGRPIRFQDNVQPSSRGNEYEGDDYRRKPRTIFDRIHPTRNFDIESDGRRFEYDAEDGSIATQSFHRGDNYVRSADRRPADVARGPREETGGTSYSSERMYSAGPKQFGIREYSDDASLPRRLRPE